MKNFGWALTLVLATSLLPDLANAKPGNGNGFGKSAPGGCTFGRAVGNKHCAFLAPEIDASKGGAALAGILALLALAYERRRAS
ncbi:VPEID-CTERM sorting domain-containing protein [Celeribacter arenosi]|uniref:VPEID-CTERM protein sorting domain-containing protein n=1 Tax=Celeribacter arenosi TaxID=792649 RepID=A0ABP7K9V3_9RHOB